jgi:hypothetical protein
VFVSVSARAERAREAARHAVADAELVVAISLAHRRERCLRRRLVIGRPRPRTRGRSEAAVARLDLPPVGPATATRLRERLGRPATI